MLAKNLRADEAKLTTSYQRIAKEFDAALNNESAASSRFRVNDQDHSSTPFNGNKPTSAFEVLDYSFGVGLNFLLAWQYWLTKGNGLNHPQCLNYVAICEQPLSLSLVQSLHYEWPSLADLAKQLQSQYPEAIKGFHQLHFGRVKLTIVQAPMQHALTQIKPHFNAYLGDQPKTLEPAKYTPPWRRPSLGLLANSHVAVIGAGISGCATAKSLSERGFKVTIIEQAAQLANGASGNRQGMLYAKLPDNATLAGQFHQQGLQYTMAALKRQLSPEHFQACGLLQLALDHQHQKQMAAVIKRRYPEAWLRWLDKEQAAQKAKQPVTAGGLYFPNSGWVSPSHWCEALYTQSQADLWLNTKVSQIHQNPTGTWQLVTTGDKALEMEFDGLVIANATSAQDLLPQVKMPVKSIRGQVSYLATKQSPKLVVCAEGYVTPAQSGVLAVGASYNLRSNDARLCEADHSGNISRLQQVLPSANTMTLENVTGGRVGFRAVTPDYLPMVGPLADEAMVIEQFGKLRQDANYKFTQAMPYLKGLYINVGHGSKGFISAPLSAEILAAQMANESLPVAQCVAGAIDPNRFIIRDLIRRKR